MCQDEITQNMRNFRLGLRPMSPDNLEIIGPMRSFPNVVLNVGYGPQGFQAMSGSKIVESLIQNTDEAEKLFGPKILSMVDSKRMYI